MSRTATKLLAASGAVDAYEIDQSLMFAKADTAYLHRTPGSAGNQSTWTWSGWVKRAEMDDSTSPQAFFGVGDGNSSQSDSTWFWMGWYDGGDIYIQTWSNTIKYVTNRKCRDPAAWYHVCVVLDTTDSTAGDRVKLFINGVRETSFATSTAPSEDSTFAVNSTNQHRLGAVNRPTYDYRFDGYMAEVHFIDGTALTPASFGETDEDTNQWVPKKVTGVTYGTNGFYCKFVSGALGTDSAGSNNYTAVNLADSDVMLDTPNNNFCTLSPLDNRSSSTLAQGNLQITGTSTQAHLGGTFNIPATGKWYFEFLNQNAGYMECGIIPDAEDRNTSADGNDSELYYDGVGIYSATIRALNSTVTTTTNSAGDIYQMAIDSDTGKVWFGTNNTWVSSGDPSAGSNQIATISDPETWGLTFFAVTSGAIRVLNCGQNSSFAANKTAQNNADANGVGDFYYAPPTNFLAMCTSNLPTPTIALPEEHFNTVLWTGADTSAAKSVTGVGFQPDFVWSKSRSDAFYWNNYDAVRGANKRLSSNTTSEEVASHAYGYLSAFDSDGFTTAAGSTNNENWNKTSSAYVAWNWKANGSGSTNEDGATDSTVSVNTTAGFSIVTFTMPSSGSTTFGHGLGAVPDFIMAHPRGSTGNWSVWVKPPMDSTDDYLQLNTTAAQGSYSTVWGAAVPTSSVFGATVGGLVPASTTGVAYCFAEVEGYSKAGTYVGNGNAYGPFVYTGFRPAWLLIKNTSNAQDWILFDNKRDPFNVTQQFLYPNMNYAEAAGGATVLDMLSNGFKLRGTTRNRNYSGDVYIYMAFAEFPFKYSNAR